MNNFKRILTEGKKLSAGLLLTDGTVILLCKVNFGKGWDIPKGEVDKGESPLQTCVREAREETGLSVNSRDLEDLGRRPYLKGEFAKDLHLFKWLTESLPSVKIMKCDSTYIDKVTGEIKDEVLGYRYVPIDKLYSHVSASLYKSVSKVL